MILASEKIDASAYHTKVLENQNVFTFFCVPKKNFNYPEIMQRMIGKKIASLESVIKFSPRIIRLAYIHAF